MKFILGNLHNFEKKNLLEYSDLLPVDQYMLAKLSSLQLQCDENFSQYEFSKCYNSIVHFTVADMSAFYFDIAKPTLFNFHENSIERKSSQTVLYHLLKTLMVTLSPIVPHFSEELFEHYKEIDSDCTSDSVFELGWQSPNPKWNDADVVSSWNVLRELKNHINSSIEVLRQDKVIGSSLQAHVNIKLAEKSYPGFRRRWRK